jgi:putative transposase
VLEPLLPPMLCDTALGGRPEKHRRRTMADALLYVLDTGCKWRSLRSAVRQAAGRAAEPSAGVIDAQSVAESAEGVVPAATSGYDCHKNVNGRKRHLLVDTLGLLIDVAVTPAHWQDRDAAVLLLLRARAAGRRLARVWADSAYQGDWRDWARKSLGTAVEVVAPPEPGTGFQVLPRRWVVERTFAWISKHRRTVRDYEQLPASHEAMITWAMIALMTRRLTQPGELSDAHLATPVGPAAG